MVLQKVFDVFQSYSSRGSSFSPSFFLVLAKKFLSWGLVQQFEFDLMKQISRPFECSAPTHALYIDDIFVYFHGNPGSLVHFLLFLHT